MPVVRELINRISFKISRAEKEAAKKTFDNLKTAGKETIGIIKGVGTALAGAAALGSKSFSDFEKDTARLDFFVRNQEEAESLIESFNKIAQRSDVISSRQARAGAAIFSTLNITNEQIQELIPSLEKLSVARPDLGFVKIGEVLREIIAGGDLEAINQIIPGFKDEFEKLSKTKFPETFGAITGEQRGEILLELLEKSRQRINDLAKKQTETLTFEFKALQKQTSDFSLRFGKEISEPLRETVEIVRELITELNKSEGFWGTVKSAAEAIKSAFEIIKGTQEDIGKEGIIGGTFGKALSEDVENAKDIFNTIKAAGQEFLFPTAEQQVLPAREQTEFGIEKLPGIGIPRPEKLPSAKVPDQSININLDGRIRVENESGVELEQVSENLSQQIFSQLRDSLNNITASNGGFVAQT